MTVRRTKLKQSQIDNLGLRDQAALKKDRLRRSLAGNQTGLRRIYFATSNKSHRGPKTPQVGDLRKESLKESTQIKASSLQTEA